MTVAMSLGVLGPLEVMIGGRAVELPAAKQRIILATLLLRANQFVSQGELIERIWDGDPPSDARGALHTHVARLRRTLGDDQNGRRPIRTRNQGYLIEVAPDDLDLARFRRLSVLAAGSADAGDLVGEADLLAKALALWRGPVLANVPSESLHRDEVPQLTEERLRLLERWFDVGLQLNRHDEIAGELRAATAENPLRERMWGQLLRALYRSGRQAEALQAYRTVVALLREELGVDPSDELRSVHQSILVDPLAVSPSESPGTAAPPVAGRYVALCQLPPDIADFVGRAEVADRLVGRLDAAGTTSAVATIVVSGPPGVGKSTLAVHAAHRLRPRFPDGQLYVSLAGGGPAPRDPAELLAELLHSTGTDALGVPAGLEARAAMWRARLADRRLLLVLDDAASAEQIRPLLPGTPGCAVLITSRNLLAVPPGATTLRLDPFTAEEAVELLGRLVGHGRVDAEPTAAREIGAACGGIPLALRIAGIRLAARPASALASLAGRLHDTRHRLDELATGDAEVRASLELSYNVLEPATQTAFRRLGLLEGADFAAWTVAVLVGEPDGERLIERLAGANLLQPLGVDGTGEPRYRLHDLLFAYAAELAARDDLVANKLALHQYFDTLSALTAIVHSNQPRMFNDVAAMPGASTAPAEGEIRRVGAEPIGWLAAERAHLCAAVAHACDLGRYPEAAMMLINLTPLLYQHGDLSPVIPLCVRVRDAAGGAGDEVDYWRAEQIRAFLVALKRPDEDATEALTSCAAGFERLGMDLELAHSLVLLSLYRNQGAPVEARGHAERALGIGRAIGDRHVQAMALTALAEAHATLGRVALALAELEEALGIARELGELHFQAEISSRLARRTMSAGDLDRAAVAAEAALRLFTDLRDRFHTGWIRGLLATISSARGRAAEAVEHAEQGRRLFARMGEQRGEADLTMTLARAHLSVGRTDTATGLLEQALQIAEDTGSAPLARRILRLLGDAHHAHGDRRAAERAHTRADALPENTDPLPGVVGGYIAAADG